MKINLFSLLLCVLFFLPVLQAYSQSDESNKKFKEISFPGGTLSEYISLLRDRFSDGNENSEALNLVVHENATEMRVPSIQLKTNVAGAIAVIELLSTDYYSVSIDHISVGNDENGNGGAVTVIRLNNLVPMRVEVLNARQLLQEIAKEKLLSAIEIGMEMQSNKSGIELKLHEETGMLFVKGTEIETDLVINIIEQLNAAMERENGRGSIYGGPGAGFGRPGGGGLPGGGRSGGGRAPSGAGRGGPPSGARGGGGVGPDGGGSRGRVGGAGGN